ncbi:MAG: hypothetical protein AB7O59_23770 [Pirellulales bacterium]
MAHPHLKHWFWNGITSPGDFRAIRTADDGARVYRNGRPQCFVQNPAESGFADHRQHGAGAPDIFFWRNRTGDTGSPTATAFTTKISDAKRPEGPGDVSSYSRGIYGIMVDLRGPGLHTAITAADFVFKVGNNNSPNTWSDASSPRASVRTAVGVSGYARNGRQRADDAPQSRREIRPRNVRCWRWPNATSRASNSFRITSKIFGPILEFSHTFVVARTLRAPD